MAIICVVIFLALSISIVLGHLLFYFSYYIHEVGHGIFAVIINLVLSGRLTTFYFSNWHDGFLPTQFTPAFSIPVPVATHVSGTVWIIGLGGFFTTTLFAVVISYYIFVKSNKPNKKFIFVFPILVFIQDFSMNFICGYDNAIGISTYNDQCPQLSPTIQVLIPFIYAILIFYFLFWEIICKIGVSIRADEKKN